MSDVTPCLLEAEGIVKTFPGVKALSGAGLQVHAGRLVALLGENGAGKSTLMNVLSGVFPPDSGTIRVRGECVQFTDTREAQERGIGIVHQELNLIPYLSVAENVFLGREPRTWSGLVDFRRMEEETSQILKRVDLRVKPSELISDLRVGQQQLVEIAKALAADARVLILDEPTSSLSSHEVDALFAVVRELKAEGVGLVYITHKFEELAPICDEVVVMRDGERVGSGPLGEMSRERIVQLMAGRKSKELFQKTDTEVGKEVLRAEGISLPAHGVGRPFLVDKVSLSLKRGEVLGIFGLVGAGRTELLECLFGVHAGAASGEVFIDGERAFFRSPADAIEARLAFAPEDRKRDGLVLPMSVLENASLPTLEKSTRVGLVDTARESDFIRPYVDRFRVKTPSLRQAVVNLSGGNQQKVILAKWLATEPRILLLDEPTRGIDVNAKREIYSFIDELAKAGLGLVVVSSELPEVLALSDRVMVMCEGRKTAEFTRAEATPERVLHAALPDEANVLES
ncbi:sugar ABC transporter ATP-binding protein [Pelagicoccus sp. SDUM812002]|uniref:sugar ABC transporter ATP-binding protein n=1 Tax=Pelagicoccus sp. SDUM812002 TaxID=3041266 RepID=UPI0028103CE0|nr:sugar ABC transporter ATP-binding protein [Pelagicoccus sp. SDUM812002]MDQ8187657.1 sugar ABC transporter ATP-binding protein [Pelagicoccus sp. SDUM812002]